MTTTKNTTDLLNELNSKAERFSNEFNFIDVDVVKTYLESNGYYLVECIRQLEQDSDYFSDYFDNYGLWDEYNDYLKDNEEEDTTETRREFSENETTSFDSYQDDKLNENYPMWNTLFEFKHNPSEEVLQAAIDSGFGVIESEHFNPMLFVAGAGYSFMSQHWIPFYLRLPWVDAEKYEGLNYSHL